MSKIIELKYDVGDTGYTMLGTNPCKIEVVNFTMSYDKKLPIEKRIQYEVQKYPVFPKPHFNLVYSGIINNYKGLDEIFDTKEELIESLTKKIEEL